MRPWAKIVIGVQTLIILLMAAYSYTKAKEASTFLDLLREQESLLVRAEQEAERYSEIALTAQAQAEEHAAEAQRQAGLARKTLEECESKKK